MSSLDRPVLGGPHGAELKQCSVDADGNRAVKTAQRASARRGKDDVCGLERFEVKDFVDAVQQYVGNPGPTTGVLAVA